MSIDDAIKEAIEQQMSQIRADITAINQKLDVVLSLVVTQQKDACAALGIDADTLRAKVLNGETEVLSADGSRLNFVTLKTVAELKRTLRKKRKASYKD